MRISHPQLSLSGLCRLFGVSRQAYYQHKRVVSRSALESGLVLWWVSQIRKTQPRLGMVKLYKLLEEKLVSHGIKLGRDRFIALLRAHGMQIRRRRRKVYTTYSRHIYRKYPNLIKDVEALAPHRLWVSDITYLQTPFGTLYLSLVSDGYSRKIVGYCVGPSLEAIYSLEALKMALEQLPPATQRLIHHSDRGIQYCCLEYVESLTRAHVQISMTQSGDPLENPIAERINGILKEELIDLKQITSFQKGEEIVAQAVKIYNTQRPHMSCDYLTPEAAHHFNGKLKRRWKNYQRKKFKKQDVNYIQA